MQSLKVNEIFYSLQGEGGRVGHPSIFIRLAKCNLTCSFCDTEFESYTEMTVKEILEVCNKYSKCCWIVWTGGEPSLQLTDEIVSFFKGQNFYQAIETNGSKPLPDGLDYICVSPKVADHVLRQNFSQVSELKYVIRKGQQIPVPTVKADNYYLSPMSDGDLLSKENLDYCIDLVLKNPTWNLTLQNHKIWSVR